MVLPDEIDAASIVKWVTWTAVEDTVVFEIWEEVEGIEMLKCLRDGSWALSLLYFPSWCHYLDSFSKNVHFGPIAASFQDLLVEWSLQLQLTNNSSYLGPDSYVLLGNPKKLIVKLHRWSFYEKTSDIRSDTYDEEGVSCDIQPSYRCLSTMTWLKAFHLVLFSSVLRMGVLFQH